MDIPDGRVHRLMNLTGGQEIEIDSPLDDRDLVGCYNAAGAPFDSRFTMMYAETENHLLARTASHPTAYVSVAWHPLYPLPRCRATFSFDTDRREKPHWT